MLNKKIRFDKQLNTLTLRYFMSIQDKLIEIKTKKELEEIISSKRILLESINLRIEFLINNMEEEK